MQNSEKNQPTQNKFALFSRRRLSPAENKIEFRITLRSLLIAAAGGLPVAGVVLGLKEGISRISLSLESSSQEVREVYQLGLSAGLSFILMIAIISTTPFLWKKIKTPKNLVLLAYITFSLFAVALGMLFSGSVITVLLLSWWIGGVSAAAWWTWEQRWRGLGLAPSPLTGVLRPEIQAGQIWFASVQGKQSTKVRPVIVLHPTEDGLRWIVAYFTTQKPKYEKFEKMYLSIPGGLIRGVSIDNWISLVDAQNLTRSNFRTYTGLAPTWVYESVIESYGLDLDPSAKTIDEESAGKNIAPSHKFVLRLFGVSKYAKSDSSETLSWETARTLITLPVESKNDRRSRTERQNPKKP